MMRRCVLQRCAAATLGNAESGEAPAASSKPKAHRAKKSPLPTYEEYMGKDRDEVEVLLAKRTQQLAELKELHMRSHRNVEYFARKQQLEHEEKALHYAEAAGKMSFDLISGHRHAVIDVRKKRDVAGHDQGIVFWACFFSIVGYWIYLTKAYPHKADFENKGILGSSSRMMGNPFANDYTWAGRATPTNWEIAARKKREEEAAAVAAGEGAAEAKPNNATVEPSTTA